MTDTITYDEPAADYHRRALDVASASGLKLIAGQSLAHFHHWATTEDPEELRPVLEFGKAFHCATLEPDVFGATYSVVPRGAPQRPTEAMLNAKAPSPSSLERQAWWAQWDADNVGRRLLSGADYDRVQRMADSVRAHPVAAGLLVGGQREATFRWRDEATGLACKSRADLYLPGEYVMDLKSCRDASAEGFARAVASLKYDLQQAHYLDGVRACGDTVRWFVFLAVESTAPFVCQPYTLNAMGEERGWKLRSAAIAKQAEAVRNGKWAGYSDRLLEINMPTWAYYNIDE